MRIKVRYFASIRELFGVSEEEYEVGRGVKLADLLLNHIPDRHAHAADAWRDKVMQFMKGEEASYIVIVNGDRARLDQELKDGDVVAILPPVGGG
ncbi:MAG: MoaD/ThiS family protein [Candidatus Nezhaarchaeales archaeon]